MVQVAAEHRHFSSLQQFLCLVATQSFHSASESKEKTNFFSYETSKADDGIKFHFSACSISLWCIS